MVVSHGYLKGGFKGWKGGRVFEFVNGQKWKQAEYKYKYCYLYRPEARVVAERGRYYLEVEPMRDRIEVRRA